jgi:hypothetical protein
MIEENNEKRNDYSIAFIVYFIDDGFSASSRQEFVSTGQRKRAGNGRFRDILQQQNKSQSGTVKKNGSHYPIGSTRNFQIGIIILLFFTSYIFFSDDYFVLHIASILLETIFFAG